MLKVVLAPIKGSAVEILWHQPFVTRRDRRPLTAPILFGTLIKLGFMPMALAKVRHASEEAH